jgi:hypothetical protein
LTIVGQTEWLVPADRTLYSLRDRTRTVESPFLICASINQQRGSNIGFANPVLYQNAENGFNDITQGNNGSYSAGSGWDPCTGLGSPNGNSLSQIFVANTTGATQAVSLATARQERVDNGD